MSGMGPMGLFGIFPASPGFRFSGLLQRNRYRLFDGFFLAAGPAFSDFSLTLPGINHFFDIAADRFTAGAFLKGHCHSPENNIVD